MNPTPRYEDCLARNHFTCEATEALYPLCSFYNPIPSLSPGMRPAVSWRFTDVQGERAVSMNLNLSQLFDYKSMYRTVRNNLLVSWYDLLIMFAGNH